MRDAKEIQVEQVWRRKKNGFLVRVTAVTDKYGSQNISFEAVDRQPRQPATGKKWWPYFLEEFERVVSE